uniref:Ribonuclease III domain-containing protein n=1 Tax=Tanacetum cinerariifolium TaxID=118510 RepID=A0A6L2KJ66_TANCI|nr:ribonuclease III domain-containing protein [Tanacetum cinerariifolium]
MCLRLTLPVLLLIIAAIVLSSPPTVSARSSQSFSDALEEIQNNLNYEFKNNELLRRAMTGSSYSEENGKDFGILARSQSSSFSLALETLQKHLNYEFKNIGLLRRAMTHSSYSEENSKAFSILGQSIIETTVALRALIKDIDISSKDLNDKISEVSKVDTSCAVDGMRLGLQNVVRVSSSTDSSTSSIVCGAFRAIFGAVALDTGKSDDASNVFWVVHGGAGKAVPMGEGRSRFSRMSKLEFPKFYGDDVKGWMFRIKQFITLDGVQDGDRIKMVSIHLFDQALTWHLQFIKTDGEAVAWDVYEATILQRFGAINEYPMAELKTLKYETTVKEYQTSIELKVRMFKPRSLTDAFSLDGLQEATIAALKQRNAPILTTPKTTSGWNANRSVTYPSKSTTTTLALPALNNQTVTKYPANSVSTPRKMLSQKEFAEKRAKNQCFYCDKKYVPGADLTQSLQEYADVFEVPTKLPPERSFDHKIPLKEDNVTINSRPYRYPPSQKDTIEAMVKELLDSSGYHQIRMCESDVYKTAFRTHEGHYEFVVMPFGLTNAPSTFQALMNSVFNPFLRKFTLVFFDDILVYSPSIPEHIDHLRRVLQVIREHNLFAKQSKCVFGTTQVEYLGHIISAQRWNPQAQEAFEKLQQAMIQSPVLALSNFNEEFVIETDALGIGLGELLAAVLALQKWRGYLLDRHFKIRTNHFSLKNVLYQRLTTPFQSKWLPKLLGFDHEIEYKRGADNAATDALSRIERQGVLFSLLAGTSNELMDVVIATWTSDSSLQAIIKGLQDKTLVNSNALNTTPYEVVYGQVPPLHIPYTAKDSLVEDVDRTLQAREKVVQLLKFNLKKAQDRMKSQADKRSDRSFEVNDWVYLKLQPYRQLTVRQHKFSSKFFGPFQVLAKVGKVAYKLKLPDNAKVHHVSQLKPCYSDSVSMGSFHLCDNEGLLAATPLKLLDQRMVKHNNKMVVFGLIQWSNRSEEDATWERLEDLLARYPEFTLDP